MGEILIEGPHTQFVVELVRAAARSLDVQLHEIDGKIYLGSGDAALAVLTEVRRLARIWAGRHA